MGVNPGTIVNWECNATVVALHLVPGIIRFLGYAPFPTGETLPEQLRLYRRTQGLSQKELAGRLGVDESTVARWEKGRVQPNKASSQAVGSLLTPSPGDP